MLFSPPLGATTSLPSTASSTLHFTCLNPRDQPQIWTNLPSTSAEDWRAVHFSPSPSQANFWTAEITLPKLDEGVHHFEYTYRIERDDDLEWLGQQGGNGRVVVTVGSEAAEGQVGGASVSTRLITFALESGSSSPGEIQSFSLDDVPEIREFVNSGAAHGFVLEQSA